MFLEVIIELKLFAFFYRYLGEKNFNFLMDLDTSYKPSAEQYTIKDERIVKNGFNVVIIFNGKIPYT